LSEDLDLDHEDGPALSTTPQRVPLPVAWQEADEEPEWPELDGSDADQFHALTAGISSSEPEREALALMLRYRAKAMVDTAHFRALHRHLTAALEERGVLYASEVKHELQRAELRFTRQAIEEASDGEAA
jgi:hypothetical protein